MFKLSEKERYLVKNLQDQEKLCIEKYGKGAAEAKDPALQELFASIKKDEQKHYDSLGKLIDGTIPAVNTNDTAGKEYEPTPTYAGHCNQKDKESDKYLCADAIATEKYTAGEYNSDLFQFGNSDVRRLMNDIETEEQNHAEKIYKYKMANEMN